MSKKGFAPIIIVLIIALLVAGGITSYLFIKNKPPKIIGGEKDSHGCLIAAGYSWCEAKQKCLRIWEEPCEGTTTTTLASTTTSTTEASSVVPIKPVACTMDAKQCPDGSYVSRISPKCEFAECSDLKTGLLKGKVTIGPLCPVEPCPVTVPNPYTSRIIILLKQTGEFFSPIILQEDGSFEAEIGAGIYTLSLSDCSFLGCNYSLPKTVTIKAGKTTEVEIDIDTGIR